MSNPVVDEPGAASPEPGADSAGAADRDRSQTTEDASARDWADTGDPEHEPALPPDHPDSPQAPAAKAPNRRVGKLLAGRSPSAPQDRTDEDGTAADGEVDGEADGGDGPGTEAGSSAAGSSADAGSSAGADGTGAQDESAVQAGSTHEEAGSSADPAEPATVATPSAVPAPAPEVPTEPEPHVVVRATGPPRRPPMLVQGLWAALLAGALAAATTFGLLPLAVAVLGVQVFLILGALALLDAPAAGGAFLVATGTTVVADALVLVDDGHVTGLAGAAGLGLVASLAHQLLRKGRSRVTESLADTLVVIVVSVAAACLLALQQVDGGEQVLLISLAAAGAVLLAGRVGDRLAPRPMLAIGSTRGWPGLLLGLGAGVACGVLVADAGGELPLRSAALLGLVVASTVATADLAVDLGAAELRSGWRDARRVAALRPTALLLPYAVLGPVALLAGRLVLA